ncbi:hypothetical protein PAEPH01_1460 [Pancytospora epiphaga]|nr:hypothetical protein PAEPH01_1460 [Pancytospora epiphaga]
MLCLLSLILVTISRVDAIYIKSFSFGDAIGLGKIVGIKRDVASLMDIDEARQSGAPTVFRQIGSTIEIAAGKLCNYPVGEGKNSIEVCHFKDVDTQWIVSPPNIEGMVQISDPTETRCIGYDVVEARTTANLKAVGCNSNGQYNTYFKVLGTEQDYLETAISSENFPIYPVQGTPPSLEFAQAFLNETNPGVV